MARRLFPVIKRIWLLAAGIVAAAIIVASTTLGLISTGSSDSSIAESSASNGKIAAKSAHKATKPRWAELTPAQREALEPLATEWDQIPLARKKKWLEIGNKMALMTPAEKGRVQERIRDWVKLTPEQRRVARSNYAQAQKIEKAEIITQWQRYQQLTEEQKKELAVLGVPPKNQVVNPPSGKNTKLARSVKSTPRTELEKTIQPPAPQPAVSPPDAPTAPPSPAASENAPA